MNKSSNERQQNRIALSALGKLSTISGYVGAEARIALEKCRKIRHSKKDIVSMPAFAIFDSEGRFQMADLCNAPSRKKVMITWEKDL